MEKFKSDEKASGMVLDVDDLDKLTDDVINHLKGEKADEIEIDVVELQKIDNELKSIAPLITTEECDTNNSALESLI